MSQKLLRLKDTSQKFRFKSFLNKNLMSELERLVLKRIFEQCWYTSATERVALDWSDEN